MYLQLIAVFLGILTFYKYFFGARRLKFPPGPRGVPFAGNIFQLSQHPHISYSKWKEEYGNIFYIKIAHAHQVVISDIKLIKECYNDNLFTGRSEDIFTIYLSKGKNGIVLSEGQTWMEQRRFTLRHLRDFGFGKNYQESLIMDEIQDLISDLKSKESQSICLNEKFVLPVLNALWSIVAGKKFNQDDPEKLQIIVDIANVFAKLSLVPILHMLAPAILKIFPKLTGFTNVLEVTERLHTMMRDTISEHEATLPEDGNPRDFIDAYLLEIKKTENENSSFYKAEGYKQLIVTISDLFFAGADTTSTTLAWTGLYLASHPEVQRKLQEEIDNVAGKSRNVALSDRSRMPYSEAVVSEILRASSLVVTGVFHTPLEDTTFHGYDIPKGTWMVPNLHAIHYDKAIWGDPENFRPERFLSADGKTFVKNENLLPFSIGKRVCIGETLARDEIFLFMTNIFQRFHVQLDPSRPKPTLESEPGFLRKPHEYFVVVQDRMA